MTSTPNLTTTNDQPLDEADSLNDLAQCRATNKALADTVELLLWRQDGVCRHCGQPKPMHSMTCVFRKSPLWGKGRG